MRRIGCVILMAALLLLTACGTRVDIIGIWEQETEIAILGREEPAALDAVVRFSFRKDGTGLQEQIIADGSYPDVLRKFTYTLEGDRLTLQYGEAQKEVFSVAIDKETIKLENNRGSYELNKAE